jgi:RimJ/RimL family protein N-acetyltransferase
MHQYERVRPLFDALRYNLVVDSVIDGNTPAWVLVDDVEHPRTALIWNRQDALLLGNAPPRPSAEGALRYVIAGEVVPDARRRHIPQLALHVDNPAGMRAAERMLADFEPERAVRRFYQPGRLQVDWRAQTPVGYVLRRMDADLLADADLVYANHMVAWIRSFWPSIEAFLETGFGYAALSGSTLASWCLTVYASGREFELGLATVSDHRNRGLATLTAAACVEHSFDCGFTPHWHCWEENRASIAVAEKVGFEDPKRYEVLRFQV